MHNRQNTIILLRGYQTTDDTIVYMIFTFQLADEKYTQWKHQALCCRKHSRYIYWAHSAHQWALCGIKIIWPTCISIQHSRHAPYTLYLLSTVTNDTDIDNGFDWPLSSLPFLQPDIWVSAERCQTQDLQLSAIIHWHRCSSAASFQPSAVACTHSSSSNYRRKLNYHEQFTILCIFVAGLYVLLCYAFVPGTKRYIKTCSWHDITCLSWKCR